MYRSSRSSGSDRDPKSSNRNEPEEESEPGERKVNRTFLHAFRIESTPTSNNMPTIADLNITAHILRNRIYEENLKCSLPLTNDERNYDTIAIAVDSTNKQILVAGNIKERVDESNSCTSKAKTEYGEFGIKPNDLKHIQEMMQFFEEFGDYKIDVVTTETKPTTPQENAESHAEMQILEYAEANNLKIQKIGISKAACACCKDQLDKKCIEHEHVEEGNKKPKNWLNPNKLKTKKFASFNVKQSAAGMLKKFKWEVKLNLPKTSKDMKPKCECKVSFNVSNSAIIDAYDNYDRPYSASRSTYYNQKGTYSSDRTGRKGVYYKAGVLEMNVQASVLNANANLLTCSANAEWCPMSGISAGVTATLAEIKLNAGPIHASFGIKASTGFSAGIDGFSAEFLGNGVSFGPREIKLRTTFGDIGVNPNAIVGLMIIAICETRWDGVGPGFGPGFDQILHELKELLIEYFNDKKSPPPPPATAAIRDKDKRSIPNNFVPERLKQNECVNESSVLETIGNTVFSIPRGLYNIGSSVWSNLPSFSLRRRRSPQRLYA